MPMDSDNNASLKNNETDNNVKSTDKFDKDTYIDNKNIKKYNLHDVKQQTSINKHCGNQAINYKKVKTQSDNTKKKIKFEIKNKVIKL